MRPVAVKTLSVVPDTVKVISGPNLPLYPVISTFLSSQGTRPHVMVMLVSVVEATRSTGGAEGAGIISTPHQVAKYVSHYARIIKVM